MSLENKILNIWKLSIKSIEMFQLAPEQGQEG